jgi:transcriptional regulator with XRE-family HTH domain
MGNQKAIDISKSINVSPSSLSLSGKRIPHPEIIVKLCEYFNVSADYLLGISDNPSKTGEVSEVMLNIQAKAEKYDELKKKLQRLASELDDES